MADARDIALQEAYAIGRRTVARRYVDLAHVLRSGPTALEDIIMDAQRVFVLGGEPVFPPKPFLQHLRYTADLADKDAAVRSLTGAADLPSIEAELRRAAQVAAQRLLRD